jgi:hypothetical protein
MKFTDEEYARARQANGDSEEIQELQERIAALEAQLAQYRWRRVEDEVPPDHEWVFVRVGNRTMRACSFDGEWFDANDSLGGVTFWMPIPPAPEEGK